MKKKYYITSKKKYYFLSNAIYKNIARLFKIRGREWNSSEIHVISIKKIGLGGIRPPRPCVSIDAKSHKLTNNCNISNNINFWIAYPLVRKF